jgi:hypothetical protein
MCCLNQKESLPLKSFTFGEGILVWTASGGTPRLILYNVEESSLQPNKGASDNIKMLHLFD